MPRRLLPPAALCLVVAGVCFRAAPACEDEERQAEANRRAGAAVRQLADALDCEDFDRQADDAARAHDLEHVMNQFGLRRKGGLGVGEKDPPAGVKDSIELNIIDLGTKRPLKAADLAARKDVYLRMARHTQAIAALTGRYPPPPNPVRAKLWRTDVDDFRTRSKEFTDAVRSGDPVRVHRAAERLNDVCTRCHGFPEDR